MQFGAPLFPYDRWGGVEPLIETAARAEQLGFAAVYFPEHIVMPTTAGTPSIATVWYDNFALAAAVARETSTIRLVFNALVVPYRHPVLTAKSIATLDQLSNGRLTIVAGTGWLRREFAALDIDFDDRGALTDEHLATIRTLLEGGDDPAFADIAFEPRCVQAPRVPIWIGGTGLRPRRRVVEFGDGWCPMGGSVDELALEIRAMKEAVAEAGRDPSTLSFSFTMAIHGQDGESAIEQARQHVRGAPSTPRRPAGSPDEIIDLVRQYEEAGLTHLALTFPWHDPGDYVRTITRFAEEVLPRV